MKNIRKVNILGLLLVGCILITNGQKPTLDSIRVQIEGKLELSISIYEYKALSDNIETDFKNLQHILKASNDIPDKVSYSIIYKPENSMSIKPNGSGERIIWENGKQTKYQFNNQCFIFADQYQMHIQFNGLEALISDSVLINIMEVIDTTILIQGRFSNTFNYTIQGKNLVHNKQLDKYNGQLDVLNLNGGVGLNLIKNQPVIDLSAKIGFMFCKKGIWKNEYYLSYNQLSHFDSSSTINLNGFINVGYRYNLSQTHGNPNWLGVELGLLASQHGDLFKKNTFKLGVNWEIGKYISVSPQFYLSGDFTEFYPAVRIGFGF